MATVMQYTFSAAIALCPEMREDTAHRRPDETRALAAHACYLIQPRSLHAYFPAMISLAEGLPVPPGGHVVLSMVLSDSEAEAFFAPGEHFTIWADGIVGDTIRVEGRIGYGVISRRTEPRPALASRDRIHGPNPPGPAMMRRAHACAASSGSDRTPAQAETMLKGADRRLPGGDGMSRGAGGHGHRSASKRRSGSYGQSGSPSCAGVAGWQVAAASGARRPERFR
jgi:hypothetical protein